MAIMMLVTILGNIASAQLNMSGEQSDDEDTYTKTIIGKLIGSYFVSGGQFRFDVTVKCWDKEFTTRTTAFGFFKLDVELPKRNVHSINFCVSSAWNDYGSYINRQIVLSPNDGIKVIFPVLSGI